jgi:hypothetical protein
VALHQSKSLDADVVEKSKSKWKAAFAASHKAASDAKVGWMPCGGASNSKVGVKCMHMRALIFLSFRHRAAADSARLFAVQYIYMVSIESPKDIQGLSRVSKLARQG